MFVFLMSFVFWFWAVIAIGSIAIIAFLENEKPQWASLTVVVIFGAAHYYGLFNFLTFATSYPEKLFWSAVIYLSAGVIWSIIKWWRYNEKEGKKLQSARKAFLEERKLRGTAIPPEEKENWEKWIYEKNRYYGGETKILTEFPKASDNKVRLTSWMAYWPWSCLWTLLNDPIWAFYTAVRDNLGKVYDKIAERTFGKYA